MNPRNPGSSTDIRPHLYDRYVSTFKSENASLTVSELSHYYRWCDARYFPFLQHLEKTAVILELGCGHGRMLHYLREKGFTSAKGIDISQEQIELATKDGLAAECTDVFQYLEKQSPASFDCIIAIDFVEHFTKDELLRMFELLHSRLKENGVLLLQTVNGQGLFPQQIIYGDITHSTILSPGSMSQLLRAVGFQDMKFTECAPVPNGAVGFLRWVAWRMIRVGANVIRKIESNKTQEVWTENFICSARAPYIRT